MGVIQGEGDEGVCIKEEWDSDHEKVRGNGNPNVDWKR
jgi:hypothetical protein